MGVGLDPNDPLVQQAAFKELIEDFWKSDIGLYLKSLAQEESDQATKDLVERAHEMTREQILAAQARIWRASMFCGWLGEAYSKGCDALGILKEEHGGDGQ